MAPRIAFVVNVDWYFWSHRLPVARAARAAGLEVTVVAGPEGGYGPRIEADGFRFVPVPLSRRSLNPAREVRTIAALWSIYRRERFDLVHHVAVKPVLYGSIAARLAGVPAVVNAVAGQGYVATAPGLGGRALRGIAHLAYRHAFAGSHVRVIGQNPEDLAAFAAWTGLPAVRAVLIRGSGVDLDHFSPADEPAGVPRIVFAGRLLSSKGLPDLVEAARKLRRDGVPFTLAVVGVPDAGNREAVADEELRAWQAEGLIEWWGKRDDMPDVLRQAAVVALPSTYGEGVPRILIEAAATGRAIVTTDTPGCREIVRDQLNGLLVPPGDPVALAGALRRLLEHPDERRTMGASGRALAVREFGEADVVRRTLDVYRDLLGEKFPTGR